MSKCVKFTQEMLHFFVREFHLMESTTTEAVIKHLQQIFATHGIPHQIVSDNGPQFTGEKFSQFCLSRGIHQL